MRLVLDTNTALSGLLWNGAPSALIRLAGEGRPTLVTTEPLLAELLGVIYRNKFREQLARRRFIADDRFNAYRHLVRIVTPAQILPAIVRDVDDDRVLAAALAGQAEVIVTGDAHLLDLKRYLGIHIVDAGEALRRLAAGG